MRALNNRQQAVIPILHEQLGDLLKLCGSILWDAKINEERIDNLEVENVHLRDLVRKLKVEGKEHVYELFA